MGPENGNLQKVLPRVLSEIGCALKGGSEIALFLVLGALAGQLTGTLTRGVSFGGLGPKVEVGPPYL